MSELGLVAKEYPLPEPKLPDVFDYDASVIKMQDLRDKTGETFKKLVEELWIAREILAIRTGRPAKIKRESATTPTWGDYLRAIGMARSTAHKWLTDCFPDREREINLPIKRAPKLPPKPSTSGQVPPQNDQALGNAMGKPEWNGAPPASDEDKAAIKDFCPSCVEGETPPSPARLNADICVQLTHLRVKVSAHADAEKIRSAQKLLSELFMLFSAE